MMVPVGEMKKDKKQKTVRRREGETRIASTGHVFLWFVKLVLESIFVTNEPNTYFSIEWSLAMLNGSLLYFHMQFETFIWHFSIL